MWRRTTLAAALASIFAPALAQDSVEARAFWKAAFETSRTYAADMSLLAYCLRGDPEIGAFAPLAVVADLHDVAERLNKDATDRRRVAELVREVLGAVRFPARDVADPALDEQCAERKVVEQALRLGPIALPLTMRPPFVKP